MTMNSDQRLTFFIVSIAMLGLGFWASTFAGTFLSVNTQIGVAVYIGGLVLVTTHATISAISYAKIEKRISALEGDPETPAKPVK